MPWIVFGLLSLVAGSALFGKGCTVSAGVTPPPPTPTPDEGSAWGTLVWVAGAAAVGYGVYRFAKR